MARILTIVLVVGCSSKEKTPAEDVTLPDVASAEFVAGVDNSYFPLPVGATWTMEAQSDEGLERIEIVVTPDAKVVSGVDAVVVRDSAYVDGVLVEDTNDWYAQDTEGNVWYLGEDTCEYENDVCVNTEGSWEWGVDGALAGIIMPASPTVDGVLYYQEFYPGHAEDVGEVIEVGVAVTVAAGSFEDCIRTHDTSTADPELDEIKTFCPGVGNVLVEEEDLNEELVEYVLP